MSARQLTPRKSPLLLAALLALGQTLAMTSRAGTLYWNPNNDGQGGAGTWSGAVWNDAQDYSGSQVEGAASDDYVFAGTAGGYVTVSATKGVNTLRFRTTGYTLGTAVINNSAGADTIGVDSGVTATLLSRVYSLTAGVPTTKAGEGTLIYSNNSALGASSERNTLVMGGLLIVKRGGIQSSASLGNYAYVENATLRAEMNNVVASQQGLEVRTNGCFELNGYDIGNITGDTSSGLVGLRLINTGKFTGGGGNLTTWGKTSGSDTNWGFINVFSGGSFDTENGNVALLSSTIDGCELSMSGGTFATGTGKLILGKWNNAAGAGRDVVIIASGGSALSGNIDLSNAWDPAPRISPIQVDDGAEAVDFIISAAIADGAQAGSGIRKTGSGILRLSGTNTFTGITSVEAGTLQLAGVLATANIIVTNGAALNGAGGTITVNDGETIVCNTGASMDLNTLHFDLVGVTEPAPVTIINYSGGSVTGLTGASTTERWRLKDTGNAICALRPAGRAVIRLY